MKSKFTANRILRLAAALILCLLIAVPWFAAADDTTVEEVKVHEGTKFTLAQGATPNTVCPTYTLATPVDLTGYASLHFDFYCSDFETFVEEENFSGVYVRFLDGAGEMIRELAIDKSHFMGMYEAGWADEDTNTMPLIASLAGPVKVGEVKSVFIRIEGYTNMEADKEYELGFLNIVGKKDYVKPVPEADRMLITEGDLAPRLFSPKLSPAEVVAVWVNKRLDPFEPVEPIEGYTHFQIQYKVNDWESFLNLPNFGGIYVRFYYTDACSDAAAVTTAYYKDQIEEALETAVDGWVTLTADVADPSQAGPYIEGGMEKIYGVMTYLEANQGIVADKDYYIQQGSIYAVKVARPIPQAPEVEDQPVMPDKATSLYLSDCEGTASGGTWAPASYIMTDEKAKTEGSASLYNLFSKEQGTNGNAMRLTFMDTLDLTGGLRLKFDLYISDVAMLKNRTKLSVRLSGDTRGTSKYIQWDLADFGDLKDGWNQISLSLTDYSDADGGFDIKAVNAFNLFCQEQSFEDEEMVRINLDNIRVMGAKEADPVPETSDTDEADPTEAGGDNVVTGVSSPWIALVAVAFAGLLAAACVVNFRKKARTH